MAFTAESPPAQGSKPQDSSSNGCCLCSYHHMSHVCVCVFSSHPFWTSSSLDVPAGVTQEEGHTGFLIHLPSARTFDEQRWQSLHPIRKVEANMSAHCCRQAMLRRSAVAASLTRAVTLSGPSPASRHGFINHRRGLRSTAVLMQFDATPILRAAEGVAASAEGGTQGGEGGGSQGARLVGIVFFSSLVAATACLGTWQVKRYTWKVELMETNKTKMASEPVDLPEGPQGASLADMMDMLDKKADGKATNGPNGELLGASEEGKELFEGLEGRRVRITGVFDHTKEVLVGPRSAPAGLITPTGPSSMATTPLGDFVHTPLRRADGSTVLVNRGWAPRSKGPTWSRPKGEVTLLGVLKAAERRNTFSPVNKPETKQLLWAEKAALLEAAGCSDGGGDSSTSPILVEAIGEDTGGARATPLAKLPQHFGQFHVTPQTHLMYSATWFALAAAGCVLTWTRFRRAGPAAISTIKTPPRGGAGK
ncbi:unnamed protein product [Ascophyllum nodosum]